MKRREFLGILSGAAAWPATASAQQTERVRRIGVLMSTAANDRESPARIASFLRGLEQLGWTEGRNMRIDLRWAAGDLDLNSKKFAAELVALTPDVLLATAGPTVAALQAETRTVPIVFAHAVDPVGAGFVASLARPNSNATGFILFEFSIGAKWLELLKEFAPNVVRVAVLRDPTSAAGIGQFAAIQAVASSFGVELTTINVRNPDELEGAVTAFARSVNGGLIVPASPPAAQHREQIIRLAARHGLPAIYFERFLVGDGGLMSYGPNLADQYRRAASYVDRILKGEKPADLPVQAPTKYELSINLKTAKALGLTVPPTLLARADEVIE
jgi:putative tryptophan/tyrosine transport system substrate-binding protein